MTAANFEQAYKYTLIDELGKDDDPEDRGGRTCDGITQGEYDAWCHIHSQPFGDVWNITDDTKRTIYFVNYWDPWANRLPKAIDYLWFDANVNSGAHEATLLLQRALGFTGRDLDGSIGIYTCQRAMATDDLHALAQRFCDEHRALYNEIIAAHPSDRKFRKGWLNRILHERHNAVEMLNVPATPAIPAANG
jgi:lysozyme family protein